MNELELILDEVLELVESGEATVDEVLARYPEQAAELYPLLQVASKLSLGGGVVPSPAFRARDRTNLKLYMQEHPQPRSVPSLGWRLTLAIATLIFVFFTTGTAFAQTALPCDALYSWKLSSENAWRALSRDPLATDLTLSNRRVNELLALRCDNMRSARALENYLQLLIRFKALEDVQAQERILPVLRSQQESLIKIGVIIPELDNYFLIDDNSDSRNFPGILWLSQLLSGFEV
jgi:hypothetical protein